MSDNNIASLVSELSEYAAQKSPSTPSAETEAKRYKALQAAQRLMQELSTPQENIISKIFMPLSTVAAVKFALDLNVYQTLCAVPEKQFSIVEVADPSGADPVIAEQVVRMLAAINFVDQISADGYRANEYTKTMADPAFEGTLRFIYDNGGAAALALPEFYRGNGYKRSGNPMNTAFQLAKRTDLHFFGYLGQVPQRLQDFYCCMGVFGARQPHWTTWYPVQINIISGVNDTDPIVVDVGGGTGEQLIVFVEAFPESKGRLILQDKESVLQDLKLDSGIELMPHDFFTPQPVKGARTYFMRWIMHDWPDEACLTILSHIRDVMVPGYSRLLINDTVIPDVGVPEGSAGLSIYMFAMFETVERTRTQWDRLIKEAGLKLVKIWDPPVPGESLVEVVRE